MYYKWKILKKKVVTLPKTAGLPTELAEDIIINSLDVKDLGLICF